MYPPRVYEYQWTYAHSNAMCVLEPIGEPVTGREAMNYV